MKKKYFKDKKNRVAVSHRVVAKFVDLFLALIISTFFYPLGLLASIGYIAICDSFKGGQSVGKKIVGFSVFQIDDMQPCTVERSIIRNLPISIPLIFSLIPLWGWIFSFIIGVILVVLELYLMLSLDSGFRLGDVMADTSVRAGSAEIPTKGPTTSWFDGDH